MYYDADADLSLIQAQEGGGHRLRIAGPRARAEPEGQRRQRAVGLPADEPVARRRRRRPASRSATWPRSSKWADVIMVLVPDTTAGEALHGRHRAEPRAGQDADVRARLQHPLRHHHGPAGRRRHDGRAEVAGPPRPRAVRRRRRHAGADRRSTRTRPARPRRWRCRTPRASASPAPASSRRRSPRRPRRISSASRRCSAAA